MNKKALSTMMAVFLVLTIGAVGYVIGTSSGATGFAVKTTNIDSANVCRYGEKQCGFGVGKDTTKKAYSVCDDISVEPEDEGKTGYQICQKQESFKECDFIEVNIRYIYLSSADNSCSGGRQFEYDNTHSLPCTEVVYSPNIQNKCNLMNYNNAVEPLYGDSTSERISHVYCCK
ncbi:hypothetical protein HYY69_03515 [Candidatus Woesearchaeota archaeon]|nr:hypothetical protein [Candidatus Woesearchaeota archaeon]